METVLKWQEICIYVFNFYSQIFVARDQSIFCFRSTEFKIISTAGEDYFSENNISPDAR